MITLALAGDTMLGRGVAEVIMRDDHEPLVSREIVEAAGEADFFILNLECCISDRGERWPDPRKPFFFRGPPSAARMLRDLGVSCVNLANNHTLDYDREALIDTLAYLDDHGIAHVGAGRDLERARKPVILERGASRLAVISFTDHPPEFAAGDDQPGVAFADIEKGLPGWIMDAISNVAADAVLVTPHWGPNMNPSPLPYIRAAAREVLAAGATLIAGHSAHVFHGVEDEVIYDLGDFLDDYAIDPVLRNDLGLLFLVTIDERKITKIEALPLKLEYCYTRLAEGDDADWIERRFRAACEEFGTTVTRDGGRLIVTG